MVSSITVSNMTRTSLTAGPLAAERNLAVTIDAGIREIEAGALEMASGVEALSR